MKKRKLTIMSLILGVGGAERVISVLSKQLAQVFETVEILVYYDKPICFDIDESVKLVVVEKETKTKSKLKNFWWLRRYIAKETDLILSFLAPLNMMVLLASIGLKKPVIVADRNDPAQVPFNPVMRKIRNVLYMLADVVIVQTKRNKVYFSKNIQEKSVIIYNPTSVMLEDKGKALTTNKKKKMVSVGRLIEQKNPFMLIDAFAKLHKLYPEYQLCMYGDGELKNEIEGYVQQLELSHCVKMMGNVKNIVEHISDAEIFVMTSNFEGMPNALIEAMCIGLPCISTRVSGAEDLIVSDKNGILIEVGDVEACYRAMVNLIEDKEKAFDLGKKATDIMDMLDIHAISAQWQKVIENV